MFSAVLWFAQMTNQTSFDDVDFYMINQTFKNDESAYPSNLKRKKINKFGRLTCPSLFDDADYYNLIQYKYLTWTIHV